MKKSNDEFVQAKIDANKKPYPSRIPVLERYFDFEHWGFQPSYTHPEYWFVIYQSDYCRVRFHLQERAAVYYGRLHAPNGGYGILVWQGEECWCWLDINKVLYFLDGYTPQELVARWRKGERWTEVVRAFTDSELGKRLSINVNADFEYVIGIHSTIWKHYGQRLFNVFDLRKQDLWERYKHFLAEIEILNGSKTVHNLPSADKIC